jgi:hypothetical protein
MTDIDSRMSEKQQEGGDSQYSSPLHTKRSYKINYIQQHISQSSQWLSFDRFKIFPESGESNDFLFCVFC